MTRRPANDTSISALIARQRAAGAASSLRALALLAGLVETGLAAVQAPDQASVIDGIRGRLGAIVVDLETLGRQIEEAQP
ncbi:MAG: hypothetical protein GXX96_38040 [Planctomycetaceae bacterium]|nr:hypothetical protein [Planctomycetaceae bacterium]